MTKTYKPTPAECKHILAFAKSEARRWGGTKGVRLEAGVRYSTYDPRLEPCINIMRVDPDFVGARNSDLHDHMPWSEFKAGGVPLVGTDRAEVDFYVSSDDGLLCNVQAEFDAGGLAALHADLERYRWVRGDTDADRAALLEQLRLHARFPMVIAWHAYVNAPSWGWQVAKLALANTKNSGVVFYKNDPTQWETLDTMTSEHVTRYFWRAHPAWASDLDLPHPDGKVHPNPRPGANDPIPV